MQNGAALNLSYWSGGVLGFYSNDDVTIAGLTIRSVTRWAIWLTWQTGWPHLDASCVHHSDGGWVPPCDHQVRRSVTLCQLLVHMPGRVSLFESLLPEWNGVRWAMLRVGAGVAA